MASTVEAARAYLESVGAPPRLLHHAHVVEAAASDLLRALETLHYQPDKDIVRIGALLHDAGKCLHPEELENPGNQHENAGKSLLLQAGFPESIADSCVFHSNWRQTDLSVEYLVIALADKLWKGKREDELESLLIRRVADHVGLPQWEVFQRLDTAFEEIASRGPAQIAESQVYVVGQ